MGAFRTFGIGDQASYERRFEQVISNSPVLEAVFEQVERVAPTDSTVLIVSLFVGASAGGLLLVRAHIYAPVLPFVITLGAVATAATALREHDAEGLKRARRSAIRGGL